MTLTLQNSQESVRAKLPHYLEPKEIEILIDYAADQSRMAANFMLTMWRAGLRVSEAINLEAPDLDRALSVYEPPGEGPSIHCREIGAEGVQADRL